MNIKNKLEAIATTNGWQFEYGRRDFQNLTDSQSMKSDSVEGFGNDDSIMFCDPVKTADQQNDLIQSTGTFMILTRSNHDKTYSERYDLFIDPLLTALKSMKNQFKCEWDVVRWEKTEVINVFDINADGILVSFTMSGYE